MFAASSFARDVSNLSQKTMEGDVFVAGIRAVLNLEASDAVVGRNESSNLGLIELLLIVRDTGHKRVEGFGGFKRDLIGL